jgi:hypothetical protein
LEEGKGALYIFSNFPVEIEFLGKNYEVGIGDFSISEK